MSILQGRQKHYHRFMEKVTIQCPMCRMESDLNNISIVTATTTTAAKAAPISGAEKGVDSSQTSSTHRGNDIDDSHIKVQV